MNKGWLLKVIMLSVAILFWGINTHAQWRPTSYYYTSPLYYSGYGYTNPISGSASLLGHAPFSPYYNPAYITSLAAGAKPVTITSYGYPYSPYVTPFPYRTTPGTGSSYANFSYPYYTHGSPTFYSNWALLNGAPYGRMP